LHIVAAIRTRPIKKGPSIIVTAYIERVINTIVLKYSDGNLQIRPDIDFAFVRFFKVDGFDLKLAAVFEKLAMKSNLSLDCFIPCWGQARNDDR
jgi:hypothetical protein